jgi:hypothetical protein
MAKVVVTFAKRQVSNRGRLQEHVDVTNCLIPPRQIRRAKEGAYMVSQESLGLGADEFAFYFRGARGVEANELGLFLQRAATVARQQGAELRVNALEPGSLAVIIKAIKRSRAARALRHEFGNTPIQATAAGATLVVLVVSALAKAMSPESGEAKPLAKVGADMVEERQVEQIEIITANKTIVVMDPERALRIREIEHNRKRSRLLPAADVQKLMESGRTGMLTGRVVDVEGELHFRPDGYRYLVPIDMQSSEAVDELFPGVHVRVNADLRTRGGQPDAIVVHKATRN